MAEIRTPLVQAHRVPDGEKFMGEGAACVPGSFAISPPGEDGAQQLKCFCPCGCGVVSVLPIGNEFKPLRDGPGGTWRWDGNMDAPTLHPSVHHIGHWHGWLKSGVWTSV